jgi:hypothetical protein
VIFHVSRKAMDVQGNRSTRCCWALSFWAVEDLHCLALKGIVDTSDRIHVVLVIPDLRNRVAPDHAAAMWLLSARGDSDMVGYVPDQLAQHRILPMVTSAWCALDQNSHHLQSEAVRQRQLEALEGSASGNAQAPKYSDGASWRAFAVDQVMTPPISRWAREGNQG